MPPAVTYPRYISHITQIRSLAPFLPPATLPGQSLEVFGDCLPAIAEGGLPRTFVPLGPLLGLRGACSRLHGGRDSIASWLLSRKGSVRCARPAARGFREALPAGTAGNAQSAELLTIGRAGAGSRCQTIPSPPAPLPERARGKFALTPTMGIWCAEGRICPHGPSPKLRS